MRMNDDLSESPEYEAGYTAYMRRLAYYCLAHAGESWDRHVNETAVADTQPETKEYQTGWREAQERMIREVQAQGLVSPRAFAAVKRAAA